MNSLTNATFANEVFPSALIYKDMYEIFIIRKGPTDVPYVTDVSDNKLTSIVI